MAYSIMMDAGHGGRDPGAVYNGRQEKDDTLRLALAISDGILDVLRDNSLIPESDTDPGSDTGSVPEQKPEPEYRIQAGAFRNRMYAERLLGELLEQDYPAYIDDSGAYARVQVGRYTDMNQAVAMERRLKRDGYQTVLLKQ